MFYIVLQNILTSLPTTKNQKAKEENLTLATRLSGTKGQLADKCRKASRSVQATAGNGNKKQRKRENEER